MEVKIGVQHANREIVLESAATADEVEQSVNAALEGAADSTPGAPKLIKLLDDKGRRVLIPADRLAYVEIGEESTRQVGFGTL